MSKQASAARAIAQRIVDDPAADPDLKMLAHAFLSDHVLIASLLPAIARTEPAMRKALEREIVGMMEEDALLALRAAADEGTSRPAVSFLVDGPGMAELRAAFEAMPEAFVAAAQHGPAIEALAAATRIVLGLEPPCPPRQPGAAWRSDADDRDLHRRPRRAVRSSRSRSRAPVEQHRGVIACDSHGACRSSKVTDETRISRRERFQRDQLPDARMRDADRALRRPRSLDCWHRPRTRMNARSVAEGNTSAVTRRRRPVTTVVGSHHANARCVQVATRRG